MKISALSTEKAADVLCEASIYALSILTDEELTAELKNKLEDGKNMSRAELYALGMKKVSVFIPILLKKHKADVFGLLAALNDTTVDAIANQNILKTMLQIREVCKDSDLIDFFKSCASGESE